MITELTENCRKLKTLELDINYSTTVPFDLTLLDTIAQLPLLEYLKLSLKYEPDDDGNNGDFELWTKSKLLPLKLRKFELSVEDVHICPYSFKSFCGSVKKLKNLEKLSLKFGDINVESETFEHVAKTIKCLTLLKGIRLGWTTMSRVKEIKQEAVRKIVQQLHQLKNLQTLDIAVEFYEENREDFQICGEFDTMFDNLNTKIADGEVQFSTYDGNRFRSGP